MRDGVWTPAPKNASKLPFFMHPTARTPRSKPSFSSTTSNMIARFLADARQRNKVDPVPLLPDLRKEIFDSLFKFALSEALAGMP